jgi:tetratricopeptide (TPR) repeat protein
MPHLLTVHPPKPSRYPWRWWLGALAGLLAGVTVAQAATAGLDDTRRLFLKGDYAECIRLAETAIGERRGDEDWRLLQIEALLALGRYPAAATAIEQSLPQAWGSVRLRLLAHEVFRANGQLDRARQMLDEINTLATARGRWAYQSSADLVALGRAALLLGAEPRRVLERFFDVAKRADPDCRDAYLASGQLALDKDDAALAAKTFQEALKKFPTDPDLHCGLAQAYQATDRKQMLLALDRALEHNPNHVPSLLLLADHAIDAEQYSAAEKTLARALQVNPWRPEAWAYRAVLAHLRNDTNAASQARANGLKFWATNPLVDHLIGRKLSQKYRFAEGAARQRLALSFDPDYLPARMQLALDLLRLGDDAEGWRLVQAVHEADGYNVTAYNLVTLHDTLQRFRTLTNQHFILRMDSREAEVYGARALALLERARANLCAKYGVELRRPVVVEIFPNQKDFAVRTFGLPDNPGYAGVCFGSVITANSPAAHTVHPVNWESVLWHEFAHVVTLQLTRNKMPRWLSEGISVFEERQAHPAWGLTLSPQYREMILGNDFKPISELSGAFLTPASERHLQFAYFEASLVVEFLVERFGLPALKAILKDLGTGVEVNAALAKHTAPISDLESQFAAWARQRAQQLGPSLDWSKPAASDVAGAGAGGLARRRNNFYALLEQAEELVRARQWQPAQEPLRRLLDAYPDCPQALSLLAQTHRHLGQTDQERAVLERLAATQADALEAYSRLMELANGQADWPAVITNAHRYLAVNPLLPSPYRYLATAAEAIGQRDTAIWAWRTFLRLDPPDPAEAHYRLARLLAQTGHPDAKRHVLQALEEAPRYREALRLLLELNRQRAAPPPVPPAPAPAARPGT